LTDKVSSTSARHIISHIQQTWGCS